jgi:hypothetical protein
MPMTTPEEKQPERPASRRAPWGLALGLGLAASAIPAPASASLLEQPPRVYTFKLDDPSAPRLSLLRAFQNAEIERPGPLRRYLWGPFGKWRDQPWWQLAWRPFGKDEHEGTDAASPRRLDAEEPPGPEEMATLPIAAALVDGDPSAPLFGFAPRLNESPLRIEPEVLPAWSGLDPSRAPALLASTGRSFVSNGFDSLWAPPPKPVPNWRCRRRPVIFMRVTGERDVFPLVRCDGSVAPEALDRLTLMARPPDVPRPDGLLPDEPDPEATPRGEWLREVRLVHPRLLWLLQRIADAFPWRAIYIYSGYRPGAVVSGIGHQSMHATARAMDIQVMNIPNVALFNFCRTLEDVGCGYYPNSKFVHVDVRHPGTGHAVWIDASGPGEPAKYVDSWPGVMESGAMAWTTSPVRPEGPATPWAGPVQRGSSAPAPPRYGGPP